MLTYRFPARGLARGLRLLGALVLSVSCLPAAQAQERRYLFELGAAGAYNSFGDSTDLGGAAGGLARVGVWLPLNVSLEAEANIANPKSQTLDQGVKVKTFSASALYNLLLGSESWAYAKLGVGTTRYGKDPCVGPTICGTVNPLIAGLGFRVGLTPLVMLRGEGLVNFNRATSDTGTAPNTGTRKVKFSNFGLNVGVSVMLGSKPIPDSDHDGVLNNRDRCADTPEGAQVDSSGCPSDNDSDGVANGVDRCPNTAVGATVDASGCPKDSDGDSIADGLDRCSDTPKGAVVDALGCPGDEDSDGVLDGLDRCPRTPIGATVNASGCAAGQTQNRAPAPAAPAQPGAARPRPSPPRIDLPGGSGGATVLEGVSFESGSARLQPGSYVELDSLVKVLLSNPNLKMEIGSHTEYVGTPADNLRLSTLRAAAVRNYLVAKGVPFQQIVARGYGATVPRTQDTTPRGRAANRRVEIRPLPPGS